MLREPFRVPILIATLIVAIHLLCPESARAQATSTNETATIAKEFEDQIRPLLEEFCVHCHNEVDQESGVGVDHLDGKLAESDLKLWEAIREQMLAKKMPPEDESQPSDAERTRVVDWIDRGLNLARSRDVARNGAIRRLTVAQYRNTLIDLLGTDEIASELLPPDGISKEGFTNDAETLLLSPLQIEAWFQIARRALDTCIVDETSRPSIQNFRMNFGKGINGEPLPGKLILGANSLLLDSQDFVVEELTPDKTFAFDSHPMRKKYRFNEGYQGNATVRGWRDYDSIYHAVFACLRGSRGYPKGLAYESIPDGLLLRPAIPSPGIFGQSSTYGPQANFKIALRELPSHGRFRVTVRARKYDDGLLLNPGAGAITRQDSLEIAFANSTVVSIAEAGVYQVDVISDRPSTSAPDPDDSRLDEALAGWWSFEEPRKEQERLGDNLRLVDSPLGRAISVKDAEDALTASRMPGTENNLNVGTGSFTVAAWIRPQKLRQAGIVCLGGYGYTHGWLFDMPDGKGVLRIETANSQGQPNGTAQSRPGVIRAREWQHVAAVVRRGDNNTRLYVNGIEVGAGTIADADLDNPKVDLHIGRIRNANHFVGDIDDVRIYQRALDLAEIEALIEPARKLVRPLPQEPPKDLHLAIGSRHFTGRLSQPAFLAVRLPAGDIPWRANYEGDAKPDRIVLTRLRPDDETAMEFRRFESRSPRIGVRVGLRRDCGHTLAEVGSPQTVSDTDLREFVFKGSINNFPRPEVEPNNINYLAGIREIGVTSEYTDGRDMPRLLIKSIEFEGPFYEQWPPRSHRNLLAAKKSATQDPADYARQQIRSFATAAFRRPISESEESDLLDVWNASFQDSGDFRKSIRDAFLVVLTSPAFLFITEKSDGPQAEDLDPWELASKLSYFLWNGPPDRRLRSLAETGAVLDALDDEVDRMIADPRFGQFVDVFAAEWLNLDKLDVVEMDRSKYPDFSREARRALRKEPAAFLQYAIRKNLSVADLIDSDIIMVNEIVAHYYGLGDQTESGFEFVPVRHESEHLGGLLTQAGLLAGLSDGREPNPVKRGAWLARKIIAEPPDDPPPNVPELEDTTKLSLRERLERHRDVQGCVQCHTGIDPWGLPFERYDAGGLFRRRDADGSSKLPDGTEIDGMRALKSYLSTERVDQVAFSLLQHLTTYAVGRRLTYNESRLLREKCLELGQSGYRLRDLVRFVVHSDPFFKK